MSTCFGRTTAIAWSIACLTTVATLRAQQLSFPQAEGAGKYAAGGRGGDAYHVTNLNDSGLGSLRHGVESANGPRTILFRVSGTIRLLSDLEITRPFLTIAGQSAPGGGITLADRTVLVNGTHDVVLQFLRFRTGDTHTFPVGAYEPDSLWIRNSRRVMIDHVSASWGTDEILSVTHNSDDVTVQWSMITEALHNAGHSSGNHGYGSLINGGDITFHHNLYAHNRSRNPRPGEDVRLDFVNNVIFSPGGQYGYSGEEDDVSLNLVGNYGIDSFDTSAAGLYSPDTTDTHIFYHGNYRDSNRNRILDGNDVGRAAISGPFSREPSRFGLPPVTTTDAVQAYIDVMNLSGASLHRDFVDHRVLGTVINQLGRFIDSQNQVGGWPMLAAAQPPQDANLDGIPDDWAISKGLDPTIDHSRSLADNGYTYLENYLHSLTSDQYPNRSSELFSFTTARGQGADAVVGENRVGGVALSQGEGGQAGLAARWTGNNGMHNEYVVLKFDIANIKAGSFSDATLNLTALGDNAGGQSLRVYGIENGVPGEAWDENTIEFADAPGLTFDQNIASRGVLAANALVLGQIQVPTLSGGEVLTFGNPNLIAFLNRATTFGDNPASFVTLLLQPINTTSNFFQFASKEHLDGKLAPRLDVVGMRATVVPEPNGAALFGIVLLCCSAQVRKSLTPMPKQPSACRCGERRQRTGHKLEK